MKRMTIEALEKKLNKQPNGHTEFVWFQQEWPSGPSEVVEVETPPVVKFAPLLEPNFHVIVGPLSRALSMFRPVLWESEPMMVVKGANCWLLKTVQPVK